MALSGAWAGQQALITLISLTWGLDPCTIHPLALELHLNQSWGLDLFGAAVVAVRCSWCCLALGLALFLQMWLLVVVTPALLAQVWCDCTPVWWGGGVSLPCCHSACCCSLAGNASLLSKQALGCCYESEISVCINLGLGSLAEKGSGLC